MSDDPTQHMPSSESDFHTQQPTQESAQPTIVPDSSPSPTTPWKKWGLANLVLLIATALLFFSFFLPWFGWSLSWSCSGSDCQAATLSAKTNPTLSSGFSVASNGVSLVSARATVDDRVVIDASTDSFSFPFLWLVLVMSIVLFLLQILMNLFKTVARWEQPFTLIITAVALSVEISYMQSAFGLIGASLHTSNTPSYPITGYGPGLYSRYGVATFHISSTTTATLHLSHGPSFGFWLGLLATLIVGGVAVVRLASQQPPPHGQPQYGQQQYGYGQPQLQYVSVWPRAGAVTIDSVILGVVFFVPLLIFRNPEVIFFFFRNREIILLFGFFFGFFGFFGYFIVMEAMWGATLGKMLLRLRVVKTDGSPISWSESVIRNLLRIVDGLPSSSYIIGAILIWTSPLRQRLGDRAAKTVVVRRQS